MINVYYPKLRMKGHVESFPKSGFVLVHWDGGGSTRIDVSELEVRS